MFAAKMMKFIGSPILNECIGSGDYRNDYSGSYDILLATKSVQMVNNQKRYNA